MDLLLKWAETSLQEPEQEFNKNISSEEKTKLNYFVQAALKSLDQKNYSATILSVLALRKFVADEIRPEKLSAEFVDFLMDQEMWHWIEQSANKKQFNNFDTEAFKLIELELRELYNSSNLTSKEYEHS